MVSARTRLLLTLALLVSGALAGADIDRALVAMPAWDRVGATAWAQFSRQADLGFGLILYPLQAIGGTLLILAAALSLRLDRTSRRVGALALFAAALLAIGGLVLTLKAAPLMLGIRGVSDPHSLRQAFLGFRFWGDLRAVCQVGAFIALAVALAALWPRQPRPA